MVGGSGLHFSVTKEVKNDDTSVKSKKTKKCHILFISFELFVILNVYHNT